MKALIVAPSWIGDTVLAQPLFMRLHQRTPGLQLDALAPRWVAPVLERMPEIAQLIDSPFAHGELALKMRHRLARRLAAGGYQRAYVLPNSIKSALVPFFAGIPERIGFVGEKRYGLINRRHTLDKSQLPQMAERFAQLAELPGKPLARPLPQPRLTCSREQGDATLVALGVQRPARLAVFCPGAEYGPAKRWPARHFANLADSLAERGYAVWLLGSAKDREIAAQIVGAARAATLPQNFCGSTTLAQAIDLLAAASFVVCNDSGLMHVAAALDRPLIAVYGSSSPGFTPPLSERAQVISLGLECSPCFKRQCPLQHLDCLNKLEPRRVLDACLSAAGA
ncbi:MAG: lipopolysaccharide heptosyltransferase II [Candidatus Accumulibacter sp.]|uniref:lipopolysaccharide heptosyltransferase II n=1 Tax=Accumulibacter sp. TaxID=2053492 RepID=UPI001D1D11D7|nr:lipopolysaccharide heptosyltransferase II [Accumulibacter sp.]MCB1941948.1 lipopolysaccharide heptosyltransferase II [Accumulibacter sp.]MCP5248069.1 lipopolysaccharide heptosyltransferase II [Accumulibacter sp.]